MTLAVPPFPEGAALAWDAPLIQLAPGEKLLEVWATPFFPIQQDAPLAVTVYHERALDCFARSRAPSPFSLVRYLVAFIRRPDSLYFSLHLLDNRLVNTTHEQPSYVQALETRLELEEYDEMNFIQKVVSDQNRWLARKFIPGVRLHKVMWQDPAPIHPCVKHSLFMLRQFRANRLLGDQIAREIRWLKSLVAVSFPEAVTLKKMTLDLIAVNESAARELAYWGTASWHADMAAAGSNLVTLWWG